MTKVKWSVSSRRRRKKILKAAKGQRSARSKLIRTAKESLRRSRIFNYFHRKKKKGDFRSLWITRVNAACEEENMSYSKFMGKLKKAGITLNRKMLADMAMNDIQGFKALVKKIK